MLGMMHGCHGGVGFGDLYAELIELESESRYKEEKCDDHCGAASDDDHRYMRQKKV